MSLGPRWEPATSNCKQEQFWASESEAKAERGQRRGPEALLVQGPLGAWFAYRAPGPSRSAPSPAPRLTFSPALLCPGRLQSGRVGILVMGAPEKPPLTLQVTAAQARSLGRCYRVTGGSGPLVVPLFLIYPTWAQGRWTRYLLPPGFSHSWFQFCPPPHSIPQELELLLGPQHGLL